MDRSLKDFLSVLGYFYLQNGKLDKALVLFRALVELFPDVPHYAGSLGYIFLSLGEYENALRQAEASIRSSVSPSGKDPGYLLKSKACWGLGRNREAGEMLDLYLESRNRRNEPEPR